MDDDRAPQVVEDLALGAFRLVKEKLGFELDFTPETLPVLDHYLQVLRDEDGGNPDEKVVALVGPCAGAYFGEVARRSVPGLRWHAPPDDYQRWRLEAVDAFLCFNPVGVVLESLYRAPLGDWHAHFGLLASDQAIVDSALEAAGPVREDDYYRLSVRHEVLVQALDVLRELARRRGERKTLGPDVYAAAVDGAEASNKA
ncbi:MAG TPA: DUF6278 family protein [Sandaracinaceae bacterium]